MLRPENAAKNAEYVGYSTPNDKAVKLLPKDIRDQKEFYPDLDKMKHLEVYKDLGAKWLGIYNDLFLQVKMFRK
jgi:spermidine/putrescine transport system substrate-binding protein